MPTIGELWKIEPVLLLLAVLGGVCAAFVVFLAIVVACHRAIAAIGHGAVLRLRAVGSRSYISPGRPEAEGRVLQLMCISIAKDSEAWNEAVSGIGLAGGRLFESCAAEAIGEAVTERLCQLKVPEQRNRFVEGCRALVSTKL